VDRITLLNVSFVDEHDDKHDNDDDYNNTPASSAADTRAASASYRELQAIYPNKNIRFYHRKVNCGTRTSHSAIDLSKNDRHGRQYCHGALVCCIGGF
jgi:hypothetical protein